MGRGQLGFAKFRRMADPHFIGLELSGAENCLQLSKVETAGVAFTVPLHGFRVDIDH